MTRPRLPIDPALVSPGRRGGGSGEPASEPVPPTPSQIAPSLEDDPLSRRRFGGYPSVLSKVDHYGSFRLSAGGLVVVVVADQLKGACARRGWSLTYLATRAGISYPTLKSILRGKAIRPRTAWKLARALGEQPAAPELDHLLAAP